MFTANPLSLQGTSVDLLTIWLIHRLPVPVNMLETQNQNYMARRGKGHVVLGRLFTFLEFFLFPLIIFVLVFLFFFL